MKSKPMEEGAAARRKKKNRQRLGGKGVGLSLESFANAKSNDTGYNPALIKKQREFYNNAKIVKKYKKSLKQRNLPERHLSGVRIIEPQDVNEKERKLSLPSQDANEKEKQAIKKKKKSGSLHSVREVYEKAQEEKERARKEREAMIQARKEDIARAEARRKALRGQMLKRTASGQPIMKHRIEHLLDSILRGSSK